MTNQADRRVAARSSGKLLQEASGELGYLIEYCGRLALHARAVGERLPPDLGRHCRLVNVTQHSLMIHADSPAWASKLRYYCPRLLAELCQLPDFGQLNEIRIKTAPPEHLQPSRQTARRRLPDTAARLLRATAAVTPASPLREALLRLASRGQI